eukprot:Skav203370  [mRNA]  locus=scaffold940:367777:371404:- [translate_table: standard]
MISFVPTGKNSSSSTITMSTLQREELKLTLLQITSCLLAYHELQVLATAVIVHTLAECDGKCDTIGMLHQNLPVTSSQDVGHAEKPKPNVAADVSIKGLPCDNLS